jgi:hypothetical protein
MKLRSRSILSIVGVVAVIVTASPQLFGQANDRELEQRVFNLGILRTGKSNSKSAKQRADPKILLAQVQEDFTGIQVTNNKLAEATEHESTLDLELVKKAITEIHTRAERLMGNLTESKIKNSEPHSTDMASDRAELKESLSMLDKLIVEFAHNRVFKEASADDDKLAAKALGDLEQIIKVSARILKNVDSKPSE